MANGHRARLDDAIDARIDHRERRRSHCVPAEVTAYSDAKRMISARPLTGVYRNTGEWIRLAEIHSVPVASMDWGGFVVAAPLAVGDVVTLWFSDASLERYLSDGKAEDPKDPRRNHLSDAIAGPGIEPNTSAAFSTDGDLVIGRASGGVQIRIDESGAIRIGSADVDLVAQLSALANAIALGVTPSGPLDTAGDAATIKTAIDSIKT